jgi:hypothetical protein
METPATLSANGSTPDAAAANGAASAEKTPLETLTEAVQQNPLDFNSWVSLLTLVQSEVRFPVVCIEASRRLDLILHCVTVETIECDAPRDGGEHVRSLPGRVPALLRLLEQGASLCGVLCNR